jgi:hypothetical protein
MSNDRIIAVLKNDVFHIDMRDIYQCLHLATVHIICYPFGQLLLSQTGICRDPRRLARTGL